MFHSYLFSGNIHQQFVNFFSLKKTFPLFLKDVAPSQLYMSVLYYKIIPVLLVLQYCYMQEYIVRYQLEKAPYFSMSHEATDVIYATATSYVFHQT